MLNEFVRAGVLPRSVYTELEEFSEIPSYSMCSDSDVQAKFKELTRKEYQTYSWLERKCLIGSLKSKLIASFLFGLVFNILGSLAVCSGIVAIVSLIAYGITGVVMLLLPFMIAFLTLNFLFNK